MSSGLGHSLILKCCFWIFSNIFIYIRVYGKIPHQHFKGLLFSNPGDKVLILDESRGQICPKVVHLFMTLSPGLKKNNSLKCWSNIFPWSPDIHGHVGKISKQHFSVWSSSNPGDKFINFVDILWSKDLRVEHMQNILPDLGLIKLA